MKGILASIRLNTLHLLGFTKHVLVQFGRNKGLLLAGAVGYNTLLSIVPLFGVLLVVLSTIFDEQQLLSIVALELRTLVPGYSDTITEALAAFLAERGVVGTVGFVVLLFFSSIAFRILEDAFAVIFRHVKTDQTRSFLVSALLPYLMIGGAGLGLIAITILTGIVDALSTKEVTLGEVSLSFAGASALLVEVVGFLSVAILLTTLYLVMPVAKVRLKRALIGGICAALLWEIIQRVVVWYFTNISLVNVLYGSLATVIIVLLTMELAAFIILLGAQVIAELELNAIEGRPWYVESLADTDEEPIHTTDAPPPRRRITSEHAPVGEGDREPRPSGDPTRRTA